MSEIWFVTGGARSGKSTFAERCAAGLGKPVTYVATLEALDDEMRDRISAHRQRRPAHWRTVEAPRSLIPAIRDATPTDTLLIDCLSLWVSNRLLALGPEEPGPVDAATLEATLGDELGELFELLEARPAVAIIVSNEVGSGIVPEYPLGRVYRDLLGRMNQRASRSAKRAWLCVAGRTIELPGPVTDG